VAPIDCHGFVRIADSPRHFERCFTGGSVMLGLLERTIATIERRLVLVAPSQATLPEVFKAVTVDTDRHAEFVRQMQAVRGAIYLQGGYVKRQQLSSGLHRTPEDERSWHLLMTDGNGQVSSCLWVLAHRNTTNVQHLRVRNCPLAHGEWHDRLFGAVESEIARARREGLRYVEAGGWAVSASRRCTSEGLLLPLAGYSLCRILGGALGITTANVTHSSSSILQRLGFSHLEFNGTAMPAYFDPRYNTMIELLRWDSRRPSAKFVGLIELLRQKLAHVPVFAMSHVMPQPAQVASMMSQPQFAA
jgi:hypothetical protein